MSTVSPAKIEVKLKDSIIITQPMVRRFSTGGGHSPGDIVVEGDRKIATKKWQGYPPQNLKVVGKPLPPLREVAMPRYTGKAEFATRVVLPDMLYARFLRSPHPRATIKRLDTTKAEKIPGVAYILTYKNAPSTNPLTQELRYQGDIAAIVAAESEDIAEDAVEAVEMEYEVTPFIATVSQAESPQAPDLREGKGNLLQVPRNSPYYHPKASIVWRHGDVEKGFAEADIVKEFTYYFAGGRSLPMQPQSGVAKWDGDQLTYWTRAQETWQTKDNLARWLGIPVTNIRAICKYNGCSFGGAGTTPTAGHIAYIAKVTGRPVKFTSTIAEQMVDINLKPETITNFKVGAKKDGKIVALRHELHMIVGWTEFAIQLTNEITKNNVTLYTANIPNWETIHYGYKSNTPGAGCSRSCTQQEIKWSIEIMLDEMAEAVGVDPVKFRLMHAAKPGQKLSPAKDWHGDYIRRIELEKGAITYDSFASVEVLEEGAKAFGWDKRNPKPGSMAGRFKRGMGMAMSQHHAGHMGYHDGEEGFTITSKDPTMNMFGAEVELDKDGNIIMKSAMSDSGTNHDTGVAQLLAEIMGFTSVEKIKLMFGDTATAPRTHQWYAGRYNTLQGGAVLAAAGKLKKELLDRAAKLLKVDISRLKTADGVISDKEAPSKRVTFAELARDAGGFIRMSGQVVSPGQGRAFTKGAASIFVEVEVDTWTGNWKLLKAVYAHDVGKLISPIIAESDQVGSFMQSYQVATDGIPWDHEFPGHAHYGLGFVAFRMPTIREMPEKITNIFVESLEPRWFFGTKGFTETGIGAIPSAIANAIYNATGVRIRNHPISAEKIVTGLRTMGAV